jgi:hypothetical protein
MQIRKVLEMDKEMRTERGSHCQGSLQFLELPFFLIFFGLLDCSRVRVRRDGPGSNLPAGVLIGEAGVCMGTLSAPINRSSSSSCSSSASSALSSS